MYSYERNFEMHSYERMKFLATPDRRITMRLLANGMVDLIFSKRKDSA